MTDYVEFLSIDKTISMPVAAATTITAGQWVAYSSGIITNATANPKDILGVSIETVDNSAGAAGDEYVTIATEGIIKAPAVVEADGDNAYDGVISVGDRLCLGGDGGTNVADGQGLVDGINASGTDDATFGAGLVVAIALEDVGAETYDADMKAILCIH